MNSTQDKGDDYLNGYWAGRQDVLADRDADNEWLQEVVNRVTTQRDELLAVLKQYHKLTAADGWYAELVKSALAKVEG